MGPVDWDAAAALQEYYVYELSGRLDGHGVLLLCEHPPLISIGREGSRAQVLATDDELASCEVPLQWTSRSGGAWVHCPGQLAAYLLMPLDRRGMGLGEYRRRFETALIDVCHDLRVPAKRLEDAPGLWTRGGQVAHFGAAVKSWVSQYGMWLNVAPAPGMLSLVRSELTVGDGLPFGTSASTGRRPRRGTVEERVTSLQEQLRRRITMSAAREAAIRRLAAAFGYEQIHTFTGHPQLTRTRRRVCVNV